MEGHKPGPWSIPVGAMLCDRYRIIQELDKNEYLAEDIMLNRRVIVTEYRPYEARRNEDFSIDIPVFLQDFRCARTDFLKWGKLLARVMESTIASAPVLDVFEANNTGYIVERYVEGVSLKRLIEEHGAVPVADLMQKLEPIIRDLEMIHRAGAFHGDITPERLIQTADGKVWLTGVHPSRKFLDLLFSIEWICILGDLRSPYVPIEAFTGYPWTGQTSMNGRISMDVYGLCATIHYCLTGDDIECSYRRGGDDIRHIEGWALNRCGGGVQIADEYEYALEKGLAMWPPDRWSSMEELYEALYSTHCRHTDEEQHTNKDQHTDKKEPSAVWKFLRKGWGAKQVSILHILAAIVIMGGLFAGLCWFNRPEPLSPEQERQATLMELGGFRSGDLSYEFVIPDVPTVWVSGYVGTGTEVTIPEEVNGFPVAGVSLFALKESGLETVYLPDSIAYDPNGFPAGCTVIGGKPKELGGSSLEQQLEEAAKAAETE